MREGGLVDINERAARAIANQLHAEVVLTLQHVQDGLRPVAGLVDAHGRAHCPQRMQGGTLMREGGQITGVARISALCMPSCSFLPPRPLVVEQPASWKEDEHIHVVAFLGEAQRVVGRRAEAVVEKRRGGPTACDSSCPSSEISGGNVSTSGPEKHITQGKRAHTLASAARECSSPQL
eukprot:CAMPEP_0115882096 /NCGR_PEP_ID=MMETSP0287-20121206/28808_1 /TAXON_ID=412157 /ORGANISM="Chrysochromulina rotalis, Strain UIO044" /LENGTH=178 /DNA_ID=CAMNT_0003338123 /DNA_START=372 /DNA_END=909 /DNA_ORIENTATION=-